MQEHNNIILYFKKPLEVLLEILKNWWAVLRGSILANYEVA